MTADPIVSISGLNKWYGDFHVLRDIDLDVARGELEQPQGDGAELGRGAVGEVHGAKLTGLLERALDERPALFGRIELGKLADVGTRDESSFLAGADDQALGRIDIELVKKRGEFPHNLGRQRIGGFPRLVQGGGGDALRIDVQPPVLQIHIHCIVLNGPGGRVRQRPATGRPARH